MKINKVRIKNFRGYGVNLERKDEFYEFDNLDKYKIIIFNGLNGNGKTSFYEAIEWALSGSVERIEKTMDVSSKKVKEASKNLIFNYLGEDENKKAKERKAIVELEFNNGWKLRRETASNSMFECNTEVLLTRDKEEYRDKTAEEKLISLITNRQTDIKSIYKSIALGQETLASFMREEKYSDKKNILMKLFKLDEIERLDRKSQARNYTNLNKKNFDIQLEEIKEIKIKINNIFKTTNYTIDQYKKKTSEDAKKIVEKYKLGLNINNEKLANSIQNLEIIKNKKSELLLKIKSEKEKSDVLLKKAYLSSYFILKEDYRKVGFLKKYNAKLNQKKLDIYKRRNEKYKSIKKKLETKVIDYNKKIEMIKDIYIDDEKRIDEKFLLKIYNILKESFSTDLYQKIKKDFLIIQNQIDYINNKLEKIDSQISIIKKGKSDYVELANITKKYLINNNIDRCPVCKSTTIEDKFINKSEYIEKIKALINKTLSNNNKFLEEKLHEKDKYIKALSENNNIYQDKIVKKINERREIQLKLYEEKIERTSKVIINISNYIKKNEEKIENINNESHHYENIKNYIIKKYGEKDFIDIENVITKRKKIKINIIDKKYNMSIIKEVETEKLNPNELENFFKSIKDSKKQIYYLYNYMKDLKQYSDNYQISVENNRLIKDYDEQLKEEEKYKKLNDKINLLKSDREKINKLFREKSEKLFKENMGKYLGLGNYIYRIISPHPKFNEFDISRKNGGVEITAANNENINLNHIFSNAQINILALSIFLGIGIIDNEVDINQLFIDDPIQSMDDLNILAFVDVIRGIVLSKNIRKNLIISTHDDNFANLLKIKLRNFTFKEFKFVYYGEEGPRIETYSNKI